MSDEVAEKSGQGAAGLRKQVLGAMRRLVATGSTRHLVGMGVLLLVLLALVLSGGRWLLHRLTHVEENDARMAGEVITISSRWMAGSSPGR